MKRAILWGGAALAVLIAGAATFFMYLRMTTAPRPVWDEEVAAYLAIVEEGQPSAEEAENGWGLVEELARRVDAEEAAIGAKIDAVAATLDPGAYDLQRHVESWMEPWDDTPSAIQEAIDDELMRLERDGFFGLTARIADADRFVWSPQHGADPIERHLAHFSALRRVDSLQQLRIERARRSGLASEIASVYAERFALARALAQTRTMMSGLIACSLESRVLYGIRVEVLRDAVERAPTRDLLRCLEHWDGIPDGVNYLKGEVHFARLCCLSVSLSSRYWSVPTTADRIYATIGIAPVLRMLHRMEREGETAIAAAALSPPERAVRARASGDETPSGLRMLMILDRVAVFRDGTLLLLAVECFRDDHGTLPATLDGLVPHYLDSIPTDPFAPDGKFVYRLIDPATDAHKRDYLLYSVGFDRRDDGGVPAAWPEQAFNHDKPGTDAVFNESEHKP